MFRTLQRSFRVVFVLLMTSVLFAGCDMFFGDKKEDSEAPAATVSGLSERAESNESESRDEELSNTEVADAEILALLEQIAEAWKTNPTSPSQGESPPQGESLSNQP